MNSRWQLLKRWFAAPDPSDREKLEVPTLPLPLDLENQPSNWDSLEQRISDRRRRNDFP